MACTNSVRGVLPRCGQRSAGLGLLLNSVVVLSAHARPSSIPRCISSIPQRAGK
ncbi:hypothetical protein PF010_g8190 [Phytophthora fragariae]|uniref:Uncharacterized protein n=1 Tax=Phytophthora fragariae TaxID=53985 RepID=A0A6A3DRD6_9STRA|nr:hypothetical protein PF009_g27075 [Phytophthora fragariae]KAE9118507.1 hypothetical protein PF010_g8190 [Phytophthora fragariae]KAE9239818.1 hypothetical protein PF002_g10074 [Phytophthora fragariae]